MLYQPESVNTFVYKDYLLMNDLILASHHFYFPSKILFHQPYLIFDDAHSLEKQLFLLVVLGR